MGTRNPLTTVLRCGTVASDVSIMESIVPVSDNRKITMSRYNKENKNKVYFKNALYRDKLRAEMIEAFGGKCLHCGEVDPIVLVLDHINDDPGPEYAECGTSARGGYWLYRKLKEQGWPKDRFQLLCCNCNMRKEHYRRRDQMVEELGAPPEFGEPISRREARAKAGPNINNSSGFKGVLRDNGRKRWLARTIVDGKVVFFGRFVDIRDAAKAYRKGMIEMYGDSIKHLTDDDIERIYTDMQNGNTVEIDMSVTELGL